MAKSKKIKVQGIDTVLYEDNKEDFISLADIARFKSFTLSSTKWVETVNFKGATSKLGNIESINALLIG